MALPTSQSHSDAPVIVGLSCRLPGARGNSSMWHVLASGLCTIGPVAGVKDIFFDPKQTRTGRSYVRRGGQLAGIYDFDAGFFGVSPREAAQMDPQQTLMLQAVWEAAEDAGLNISDLAGERTGVFIGASIDENLGFYYADPNRVDSSFSLGNTLCIIANRVSATFDFGGPSHVTDTACASGLYALHQAADALRHGDLDTAIVGAVHVTRTPGGYIGFSQARMLSPTGICHAFDASADGYVRSEACVALVLQREAVAQRMSSRSRARILASGVNSDGGASQLTVPSAKRQEALIDAVLHRSQRDPEDLDFYEAHGTGTAVGDPIEATSIGSSLGVLRREPLLIGSSKTNFGHSEPAAGLVGLAKVLLAFEHRALPASLHFTTPNPNIDFEHLNLRVNTSLKPLDTERTLVAGINSFGFGGVNASVIVESISAPQPASVQLETLPDRQLWLLFSAASDKSLRLLSGAFADLLEQTPRAGWPAIAAASAARPGLDRRIAIQLNDETPAVLRQFAEQGVSERLVLGVSSLNRPRTALAFAGNGAQFAGMGRAEYARDPEFRTEFDRASDAFAAEGLESIADLMHASDLADRLGDPLVAQPLLFSYQVALCHSLKAAGLKVDAVIGHSLGEIAALYWAGCYDLQAAVKIIVSRSRLFRELRGSGTMAAIAASQSQVERAIQGVMPPAPVVAAVNSPRSTTVSGTAEAIDRLSKIPVDGKRLPMVRLNVEVAYHSPQLDPHKDVFINDLKDIQFTRQSCTVASSTLGRLLRPSECSAEYLWHNTRDTVQFSAALTELSASGAWHCVEIAPQQALSNNIRDIARYSGRSLASFFPETKDHSSQEALSRAWVQGIAIEVSTLSGQLTGPAVQLPAYPWDEAEHQAGLSPDGLDLWNDVGGTHLVGRRPERAALDWMAEFTPTWPSWCAGHKVGEVIVLPATALLEMALGAGQAFRPGAVTEILNFDILSPALVEGEGIRIHSAIDRATNALTMSQRPRLEDTAWTPLVRATIRSEDGRKPPRMRRPSRPEVETAGLYDALASRGLHYGEAFRRLASVRFENDKTVWARLSIPPEPAQFLLDLMALDASFHALAMLARHNSETRGTRSGPERQALEQMLQDQAALLPVRVRSLRLWQPSAQPLHARVAVRRVRKRSIEVDITLCDSDFAVIATLEGVEFLATRLSAGQAIAPSRTTSRPIRLRKPGSPVELPRGWKSPEKLLARLGTQAAPDRTEVRTALASLRQALVSPEADRISAVSRVLHLAPDLAEDVRALMLSAQGTAKRDVALYGWAQTHLWKYANDRILTPLLKAWPAQERLNILLRGLPNVALLEELARDLRIDRLAICEAREEDMGLLRQILPARLQILIEEAPAEAEFDIILSAGVGCAESEGIAALAPGGLAFRVDVPDLVPGGGRTDWPAAWETGGILPLQVSSLRKDAKGGQIATLAFQPELALPLPEGLPLSLAEALQTEPSATERSTHRILPFIFRAEDDPADLLARSIWALRFNIGKGRAPLISLCYDQSGEDGFDIFVAGLTSAMRTLRNEAPERDYGLLAIHSWPDGAGLAELAEALSLLRTEDSLHINQNSLWTHRFCPVAPELMPGQAMRLAQRDVGRLESLSWQPGPRPKPGAHEIEINVTATGLNFRDVMMARGVLPERIFDGGVSDAGLGMECSGVVTRVGKGSTFAVGDRVIAFAASAFASHVILPDAAACALPPELSLVSGAAIPVAFVTAWEALTRIARIRPGDQILIHGAAGGVGMAAMQIAKLFGARVIATAGTAEKRMLALAEGAEHAFSSRELTFANDVLRVTGGRGVDIVLNSLSGEAMRRSVECLAPFGRFIELGKRDYLENTRLDLHSFSRNLSYFGVDLDQRLAADPEGINQTMREISAAFADGRLRPLPVTLFAANDSEEAFRHMLAARHTGKIAIAPATPRPGKAESLDLTGEWVILGGTGGVGLAIAHALVAKGVERVHLLSRSGTMLLGAERDRSWAETSDRVQFHAVNAADPLQLEAFFAQLDAQGCTLSGVIHAAMVLRDKLIADIDIEDISQVFRAKLGVAQTLDAVLRRRATQPDHVVFFSSIAALLGNPGQVAYSAANAGMEQIVAARHRDGLPGLSIGWGPIRDTGYLTRETLIAAQLSKMDGIGFLSISDVVAELMRALSKSHSENYCFASVDWSRLAPLLPALGGSAFVQIVPRGAGAHPVASEMAERLRKMEWPAALTVISQELSEILGGILRMPPAQFDLNRSLARYGIDSLMAMELMLEVERRFGRALPVMALSEEMTGTSLAAAMLTRIREEDEAETPQPLPFAPDPEQPPDRPNMRIHKDGRLSGL